MTRHPKTLLLACAAMVMVSSACEPDRIEEKTIEIAVKSEKRVVGDRVRNFVDRGYGEEVSTTKIQPSKDGDLEGNFGAFEAFPNKSQSAYFLGLLETPSKERSVTFLGRFEGDAYLKVVFAPKANLNIAKTIEGEDKEDEDETPAKAGPKRQNLEMVRVIRAAIDDLGETRLNQAIAKNQAIHDEGGFPYQGALASTSELLFRKRFEEDKPSEED